MALTDERRPYERTFTEVRRPRLSVFETRTRERCEPGARRERERERETRAKVRAGSLWCRATKRFFSLRRSSRAVFEKALPDDDTHAHYHTGRLGARRRSVARRTPPPRLCADSTTLVEQTCALSLSLSLSLSTRPASVLSPKGGTRPRHPATRSGSTSTTSRESRASSSSRGLPRTKSSSRRAPTTSTPKTRAATERGRTYTRPHDAQDTRAHTRAIAARHARANRPSKQNDGTAPSTCQFSQARNANSASSPNVALNSQML